jgi:hypothetical protein
MGSREAVVEEVVSVGCRGSSRKLSVSVVSVRGLGARAKWLGKCSKVVSVSSQCHGIGSFGRSGSGSLRKFSVAVVSVRETGRLRGKWAF